MGDWRGKSAKLIDKKPPNLMGKLKRKTDDFDKVVDEKVVDKKVVNKKPPNLVRNWGGKLTLYG